MIIQDRKQLVKDIKSFAKGKQKVADYSGLAKKFVSFKKKYSMYYLEKCIEDAIKK